MLHLTKFWASATNCTDSRGIFAGGIVHLRLSMCLQKGATIDFEVDGLGSQASPADSGVHPLVAHDPCHDSELVEAAEAYKDISTVNLGIWAMGRESCE